MNMMSRIGPQALPSQVRYEAHLRATIDWLRESIRHGNGGSCAHYSPLRGWSAPYPETTGYIIPTLIDASAHLGDRALIRDAEGLGNWLLTLQQTDGWWPGGLYRSGGDLKPSVFNTAQIIDGMVALAEKTGAEVWQAAARRGALWLAEGVDEAGLWQVGNYRPGFNPSYYSQVAWPMLRCWRLTGDAAIRSAAERVLDRIAALRLPNGVIAGWGFAENQPAFTHTIAYTLRGFQESAEIVDRWSEYGAPIESALERLARSAEFSSGRLPGAFHDDWRPVRWYSCLTGNVQVALCLLRYESRNCDLRLVNAAAKLVDHVCSTQSLGRQGARRHGAVAGSSPLWGRYMAMRYPNWAAKYHADALMALRDRTTRELGSR